MRSGLQRTREKKPKRHKDREGTVWMKPLAAAGEEKWTTDTKNAQREREKAAQCTL